MRVLDLIFVFFLGGGGLEIFNEIFLSLNIGSIKLKNLFANSFLSKFLVRLEPKYYVNYEIIIEIEKYIIYLGEIVYLQAVHSECST